MKVLVSLVGSWMALAAGAAGAQTDTPSVEELWEIIQLQQEQIEELQNELRRTRSDVTATEEKVRSTESRVSVSEERIEAAAERVEEVAEAGPRTTWADRTHLGGYGELHYNGGDADEIDLHRFVLFFGHQFSDSIRFQSEVEIEHALSGDGQPGEVELEQAYLEFDLNGTTRAKGGVFLVPVGLLNETHEPTTFYGVERNRIESNIIPTTWWEAGGALSGELAPGFSYDLALHSGLETSAQASYAVRSGRQKVSEAKAEDFAYTGRMKWTGIPGLEIAGTVQYQQDITQSQDPLAGSATLWEAHVAYNRGPFGLRALAAHWDLDGPGPEAVGADEQEGWFIEPSWRPFESLGFFARYGQWDNMAGNGTDSQWTQTDIGFNYWPHPNVVLKADYQSQEAPEGENDDDRINLGIGYQF